MGTFQQWLEGAKQYVVAGNGFRSTAPTLRAAEAEAVKQSRARKCGGEIMRGDNRRIVERFEYSGGPFESVAFTIVYDVAREPMPSAFRES